GAEETLGLLLIDVDFFKHINDTYGHQEGDLVLKQVAACISSIIRGGDIAGRFGGDEFIVLLPTANAHAVAAVAKRLQDKIRSDDELVSRKVTLSIGCASQTSTQKTYDSKQLLKQADDALYHAKENGRNQFIVYQES
ncbi:MAG: GGDEF domain-containing protein, partial [Schwartzia sp.]|nr:GGDEF domain-containing protein [Schwartzia sp. (in: firmicutes)]